MRILFGKNTLGLPTRPFAAEVTVKAVVDEALEPHQGVELVGPVDVFKDAAEAVRTLKRSPSASCSRASTEPTWS